jgi:preprotein translocase subunit SecG
MIYPLPVLTAVLVALHVLFCVLLVVLVLAHSGKDSGLSGAFGIGQSSFGATQVMERNLTRLTVIVAVLMVISTIVLGFRLN